MVSHPIVEHQITIIRKLTNDLIASHNVRIEEEDPSKPYVMSLCLGHLCSDVKPLQYHLPNDHFGIILVGPKRSHLRPASKPVRENNTNFSKYYHLSLNHWLPTYTIDLPLDIFGIKILRFTLEVLLTARAGSISSSLYALLYSDSWFGPWTTNVFYPNPHTHTLNCDYYRK